MEPLKPQAVYDSVNFYSKCPNNLIIICNKSVKRFAQIQYLVILAIELGQHGNVRETHDGNECQLPRHAEHEDEESDCFNKAAQEQVDVLRDEVAHLRGV